MIFIEFFDSRNKKNNLDIKMIEDKVIDLLKNKGSLTFSEIIRELMIENGDREILLSVLNRLVTENKLKKEKIHTILEHGINLTSKFSI